MRGSGSNRAGLNVKAIWQWRSSSSRLFRFSIPVLRTASQSLVSSAARARPPFPAASATPSRIKVHAANSSRRVSRASQTSS